MKRICALLVLICGMLLTGCGFHTDTSEFQALHDWPGVYVSHVPAVTPMEKEVKRALERSGVPLCPNPMEAPLTLNLTSEWMSYIISVSSGTQIRQYRITYQLQYEVLRTHEDRPLALETITLHRTFTQNENQMLGSDNEKHLIEREMRQEMVYQLLLRLAKLPVNEYSINA